VPTVLREKGYRFHFYMADRYEPPHIHIAKDDAEAKFWIDPLELADNEGFRPHDLAQIKKIILEHIDEFILSWYNEFGHLKPEEENGQN
jgi:Domain of unknown function (DUF4160)